MELIMYIKVNKNTCYIQLRTHFFFARGVWGFPTILSDLIFALIANIFEVPRKSDAAWYWYCLSKKSEPPNKYSNLLYVKLGKTFQTYSMTKFGEGHLQMILFLTWSIRICMICYIPDFCFFPYLSISSKQFFFLFFLFFYFIKNAQPEV